MLDDRLERILDDISSGGVAYVPTSPNREELMRLECLFG